MCEEQTRAVLHLAFICELYEIQVRERRYFLHTHTHSAKSWDQPTAVDFTNRFSDMFQTVTDRDMFSVNTPTRCLTNSGCIAQALSTSGEPVAVGQTVMKAMSQQLQSNLCDAAATDQPQHRLPLPTLDILAVDADEEPQQEWQAEDDVKGGPLDPHEVKIDRQKEIQYLWDLACTSTPPKRNREHERDEPQFSRMGRYQRVRREVGEVSRIRLAISKGSRAAAVQVCFLRKKKP